MSFEPDFVKLNFLSKFLLKLRNRKKYNKYKVKLNSFKIDHAFLKKAQAFEPVLEKINITLSKGPTTTFKHSGNIGDLIYSIPCIKALSNHLPSSLFLEINVAANYAFDNHPMGDVRMNEKIANTIIPLLNYQPFIAKAEILKGQSFQVDLDLFREAPIILDRGNISSWYLQVFGADFDLSTPWLTAPKSQQWSDKIVIARSFRYRNPLLNYSFLKKYLSQIIFVGVESEYQDMLQCLPGLKYQPVKDFLELAEIIHSSMLFIGNQSFPYSIAEALKIKRIIEVCPNAPVVMALGANGYEAFYQHHFENKVAKLVR